MKDSIPTAVWLIDSLRMGGAERLAMEFARQADPARVRVELVALGAGPQPLAATRRQYVIGARHLRDRAGYERLCRLLGDLRADLVHTHLQYAHIWGTRAARRRGLPCVSTLHTLPQPAGSLRERVLSAWERRQLGQSQAVIAVSRAQAAEWRRAGLAPTSLRVIPNGVALGSRLPAPEQAALRCRLGLEPHGCLFLTVAVVRGRKGWRHLLAAVPAIRRLSPGARFVWVGDGPELGLLREAVHQHGLDGVVHLAGQRQDVPLWLQAADVFLFPSEEEALPTALLEAMAAGLPVVASRLPAVEEVLSGQGESFAVGDAGAMAAAAARLAVSAARRRSQGDALRQRVQRAYTVEVWTEALTRMYEELLHRQQPGSRAPFPPPTAAAEAPPAAPGPRLLALEWFGRGGLFHYTLQMSRALARQGAEVTLLTGRHPEIEAGPGQEPQLDGVRLLGRLPMWNPHQPIHPLLARPRRWLRGLLYLAAWGRVLRTLRRDPAEVVLLGDLEHRCDGWFVGHLAQRGIKLVDIWHNVISFNRYGGEGLVRQQAWRLRMARHFDTIFVHGAALARQFEQQTGQRATVIPHGNQQWILHQAGPDPDLRQRLRLPGPQPVALLFGSLTRYKGVDVLLDALARIAPEQRPVTVIAGYPLADFPLQELQQRAGKAELGDGLRWQTEYIPNPEIAWYFRLADFVVLPYQAASQSGVAHLALTLGKPLIVTRTGSLAELIDGERNGLVVEPGDPGELAKAIARLTADAGLRQRMGAVARELALTRHDWDSIARQVLAAIAGEADRGEPRPPESTPAVSPARTG